MIQNEIRNEDGSFKPLVHEMSKEIHAFFDQLTAKYANQITFDSIAYIANMAFYENAVMHIAMSAEPTVEITPEERVVDSDKQ